MRRHFLICVALLACVSTVPAYDISTLTGQTYRNVAVMRVDQTGIAINHRDGTAFLPFSILPTDVSARLAEIADDPDSIQPTPELAYSPEIATLNGDIYRDVAIIRVERTGIRVSNRDGFGFIDYLTLPIAFRRRYGYTEAAYAVGKTARRQRELAAAETQRRIAADAAAREAEAQRRLAEAQAALARQQASIATRDYSTTNYTTRDYGTDRYTGSGYTGGPIPVSGYTRKDGTYVHSYTRRR